MKKFAPNFLQRASYASIFFSVFLFCILSSLIIFIIFYAPIVFFVLSIIIILIIIYYNLDVGIGLLFVFGLTLGLVIDFSQHNWSNNLPYISNINAPVVDFLVLMLYLVLFLSFVFGRYKFYKKNIYKQLFILTGIYGIFLIWSLVAVYFSYEHEIFYSLKFYIRNIVFVFPAFVILPALFIKNKEHLESIFSLIFWIGIIASLFGLSSLIFSDQGLWLRFQPYEFFGIAPFRYNHNSLAEVLTIAFPLSIYLYKKSKNQIYFFGSIIIGISALLTLSRTAWIVMFIYLCLLLRKDIIKVWKKYKELAYIGIFVTIPIVIYMALFLGSNIVDSSTSARAVSGQVVAFYSLRSPLVGFGPGSYIPLLSQTSAYVVDFGDPLDAHGFIQKIVLETGIIGLLFCMSFFAYLLSQLYITKQKTFFDVNKDLIEVLLVLVAGALVFQLFSTSYFSSILWLPVGLSVTGLLIAKKEHLYGITK